VSDQNLDEVWEKHPNYIRRFYDNFEDNKKLCKEVEYILSAEITKKKIEIAQVTSRAKTLESFCEKLTRKAYNNPFDEITDFSGVRVVYLYSNDKVQIENIIEKEFDVVEKVDKVLVDDNVFGYGALHYLVKIKNTHAGARYDDLKNKVCEIQVRTILQDAWAVIAHHLSYKQESDVPKKLRRKLNALSGLFETADDQFQNIRDSRESYQKNSQKSISSGKDLPKEETDLDKFGVFLKSKFPARNISDGASELLNDLKEYGYKSLFDIDKLLNNTLEAAEACEKDNPPANKDRRFSVIGIVRTALVLASEEYEKKLFGKNNKLHPKFRHLIKSV
jgi:ppGpp synthetase/RelA/SpoT-type nucleotidyltranferase